MQIDNMNSQDAQIAGMAFKCRADAALGFEWVDEGSKRVTGYTHTELVETGKIALPDLVQPAGRENVRKMIQDGINRLGSFAVPFGILTKERVPAEGMLIGKGVFSGPLTLTGIEGYLLRMQAPAGTISGAGVQLPGDLWQQLLDHTGDIITYIASDGTIRYITPSVLRILGYRPEEIVMTRFSALLTPGEAGRFEEVRERVHLIGSGGSSTRFQAVTAGGAPVPVLIRMFGSADAGGVILAISPVQEEKPLSSPAEELCQAACRASPVPLLITGRKDRRIIHTNDAFLRLTGHGNEDEVIGLTLSGAGLQATTDELDSIESVLDMNGGYEGEMTTIRTSLSEVSILLSARSFDVAERKVIIWSLVPLPSKIESRAGDGRAEPEGAKEHARRYKAGLQLLEGVMSTKSLHADIPSGMVIREMRTFLHAVSGFYVKQSGPDQTMICAYLHAIGDHITEKYEDLLGPVPITIRCDGDWIMSSDRGIPVGIITTELVINSITHAFAPDENGRIEVIFSREEDWYILEVRDTGKGLPEEITRGQPTSAGLSLVEDLAMQISGTVTFSNDAGARVRIIFPDQ